MGNHQALVARPKTLMETEVKFTSIPLRAKNQDRTEEFDPGSD
jgi:hypothetical protein